MQLDVWETKKQLDLNKKDWTNLITSTQQIKQIIKQILWKVSSVIIMVFFNSNNRKWNTNNYNNKLSSDELYLSHTQLYRV